MIEVIAAPLKDKKKDAENWESRFARLRAPLDALRGDASPGAIVALKERADPEFQARLKAASTSPPLRPALTRALVDAWSMTSLEQHTGRPDIQPWLRGWEEDEQPQTQVIWRKHLPVRSGVNAATFEEINAFFDAAPPHMSEVLETETWRTVDWLVVRAAAVLKAQNPHPGAKDSPVLFVLNSRNEPDRSDGREAQWTLGRIAKLKENKKQGDAFETSLRGRTIVVSAALGGLNDAGMLDEDRDEGPLTIDTQGAAAGEGTWSGRPFAVHETADPKRVVGKEWKQSYRFAVNKSEDGSETRWLVVYEYRRQAETEEVRAVSPREQTLAAHQRAVVEKLKQSAQAVGLPDDYVRALAIAARLHDEGKALWRWQRAFNAPRGSELYAKTRGPLNIKLLDGYRHEFGSLWKVRHDPAFAQLDPDMQDLVLHLVAAHHGYGRPVISTRNCEDDGPEQVARDVALRFARLQKRWGPWGLAWWEALLRSADQQASREDEKVDGDVVPDAAEEVA